MERYNYRPTYFLSDGNERISIILVLATNRPCVDLIMVNDGPVSFSNEAN